MHELIQQLTSSGPVITDGAWGTQLQGRGLEIGACPDEWNLVYPKRVEQVARAYVDAGSQIIITNTFGANRFVLDRQGLSTKVVEINRAGVDISRRAAEDRARVFASMGPSGVMLVMGQVKPEELRDAFTVQAGALADSGADGIVVETMSDLEEAKLAVAAALETKLPVVACMTFDAGKDHDRTRMCGTTPEQAAQQLTDVGADCIGSNCGQGIEGLMAVCRRLKASTERPIWIKANAGPPELVGERTVYAQSPENFAAYVPRLAEVGASFIGGCCGTTPEFIRAVKEMLKR